MHQASSSDAVVGQEECRTWSLQLCLRRSFISGRRWHAYSWSLLSVSSDRQDARHQQLVSQALIDEHHCDYHWSGIALQLYRDERAAYRFNLTANHPQLFVVCNEESGVMQPFLVTASQDEAAAYMDGGEEDVFSIDMPAAIQCWIEGFIARHGEPEMAAGKSKRRHHGRRSKPSAKSAATGGALR